MSRVDYYHDDAAPPANSLVPAASVVAFDGAGAVLLQRRTDNSLWTIPGGRQEPGETIRQAAVRETKEETGYDVSLVRLVGVYSDPGRIVAYSDGEARQEFSVCFEGRLIGGAAASSDETLEVALVPPSELGRLEMHESIRLRVQHCLERRSEPYVS